MRRSQSTAGRPPTVAAATALLTLLALLAAGSRVTAGWADGDPASDILPVRDVFFPYQPNVSPSLEAAAERTVHAAAAAGFPLKVAIIRAPLELGLVQQLSGRPQAYAEFLDREISFNEPKKLLVVMPNGFGTVPASLSRALARLPIDTRHGSDGLTRSAILAVVTLARARGSRIAVPPLGSSSPSSHGPPALLIFGLPAALLALGGLVAARVSRSRRESEPHDANGQ